jgi:outer membrane protein
MKPIVVTLLASALAAAAAAQTPAPTAAPAAPASAARIGVLNVDRLVQESALGKEAFGRIKKIADLKKEDSDKLQKELREIEQKLQAQGQSLAEDRREALQKQYQEKAIAYKRFQDDANRELEQAQKKELAQLEQRVFPVINQVGKERGFTLIFNRMQSGLVYADETVDITDEVIRRFNTIVAVPPAKPTAAASAKPTPTPAKK